ncbi:MAG: isoprenyl transferase [Clostridia bacterium]|nr:isoprenyl transferase [Clostridia bacterium]
MRKEKEEIDFSRLPQHVAFIMDGNGRWAKKRGMPRVYGHKIGANALIRVVRRASEIGLKVVSFYAFSTENWNRPQDEINEIFRLCKQGLKSKSKSFIKRNMRFKVIGDISKLPKDLAEFIVDLTEKTKNNTGLIVNVALNYGGRAEIIQAVNNILEAKLEKVDEATFASYLQTADIIDPDFVIRTSGEQRLSNFMMYECAYSELYFPKKQWPAFNAKEFDKAIIEYQKRDRRFGAIKK